MCLEKRPIGIVVISLIILILAATGNRVRTGNILNAKELALEDGAELWIWGQVEKKEPKEKGEAIILQGAYTKQNPKEQYHILVYISEESSCQIGDKIKFYGKVKRLQVSRNKGMFHQALYYKAKKIQYICSGKNLEVIEKGRFSLRECIYKIRIKLYNRLHRIYPEDTAELLAAILLGIKSGLEEETKDLYQKSGILHLISISGLHISCIGLGLYHILRKLGAGFGISGAMTALFLGFYYVLSGESVSALRAVIMAAVMMGAWYLGRSYDLLTALFLAAFLILIGSPYQLYQSGFQLSFGAVLGIGVVSPEFVRAFGTQNRMRQAICMNLGIQFTTLPIILYYYYEIPLYSLLLNLVLVPGMSLVLCCGLLGLFSSFFGLFAGRFLGAGAMVLLTCYEKAASFTIRLPFANLCWGQPALWEIMVYYLVLGVVVLVLHKMNESKDKFLKEEVYLYGEYGWEDKVNRCCLAVLLMFCMLLKYHPQEELKITMLDVGQGDSMVIEQRKGGVYLVDGGSTDVKQVGTYRILPFLKAEGIEKIQGIFISHMDFDHICGIKELLECQAKGEVQIECVYLPDIGGKDEVYEEMEKQIREQNIEIKYLSRGMELEHQGMKLKILQPIKGESYEGRNEYSMVFQLDFQEFSMLFTGDVEGKGEEELLVSGQLEKVNILKAAHHGSEYTMCEEVLEQIHPKATWISCGEKNSYGHPHKALLERIKALNSEIYVTMKEGAITVETDGTHMIIYEKCK